MINSLSFKLGHPKWGTFEGQYEILDNYIYFKNLQPTERKISYYFATNKKEEELLVVPEQFEGTIQYLKLRFSQQLDFWKFSLANTAQYQRVKYRSNLFSTPQCTRVESENFFSFFQSIVQ